MANMNIKTWQEKLQDYCKQQRYQVPIFNIVSDRRGGRTAWSATVTIQGQNVAARMWYDGQYINNAKEDAAEVALMQLNSRSAGGLSPLPSMQASFGRIAR